MLAVGKLQRGLCTREFYTLDWFWMFDQRDGELGLRTRLYYHGMQTCLSFSYSLKNLPQTLEMTVVIFLAF